MVCQSRRSRKRGIFTTNRHEPARTRTIKLSDSKFVLFVRFVVKIGRKGREEERVNEIHTPNTSARNIEGVFEKKQHGVRPGKCCSLQKRL